MVNNNLRPPLTAKHWQWPLRAAPGALVTTQRLNDSHEAENLKLRAVWEDGNKIVEAPSLPRIFPEFGPGRAAWLASSLIRHQRETDAKPLISFSSVSRRVDLPCLVGSGNGG